MALARTSTVVGAPFSFDDIEFWVGSGANRAAVVIDWVEGATEPAALAWGFRWDGSARGSGMLTAVVAADPRLFAKLGGTRGNPSAVYGLGYDADNDSQFGIDDGTEFDADGFAFSGPADLAVATDASDYYAEGWFTGFWHYGVASVNPYASGSWSDTAVGMQGRVLTDGAWDSWVFSPSFNFAAFAENPTAAQPPSIDPWPGDYSQNGIIDAADYVVWRKAVSAVNLILPNDPTPGEVDELDYLYWRAHFGESITNAISARNGAIPEPASWHIFATCLFLHWLLQCRQQKENDS